MSRNRYEKIRVLGAGSFGEAWLVRSTQSQRQYVIKEMKMLPNLTQQERDRVTNEVSIISSCCHVNIVKYKDYFITQKDNGVNLISIVMEFAEGGDLSRRIQKQKEANIYFPEAQVRNWFVQLCFALQYLHKKNIMHRDIKTQNIFIGSNKLLKLGDFGISKTLRHENDFATTSIGSPQYLSPEICRQLPYDLKSDIWSLGCVLYEICALVPAFPGGDLERLIQSILRGVYKPIPADYSSAIAELIKVMLRPEPARRPTIGQLVVATVLKADVLSYMEHINTLSAAEKGGDGSSTTGSDFRKNSTTSLSSADGQQSTTST